MYPMKTNTCLSFMIDVLNAAPMGLKTQTILTPTKISALRAW
jgi:hypothetical protein